MRTHLRWPLLALIIGLSPACAVYESWPGGSRSETNQTPAPVVRKPPIEPQAPASPEPQSAPSVSAAPLVLKKAPQPTGPAGFLLDEAERKRRAGDLTGAAVSIERAMRIQAGNPWLSLELAAIRLEQGNTNQAELLAQRALSQAGGDVELQNECWSMTARARRAAGDSSGAAAALEKMSN